MLHDYLFKTDINTLAIQLIPTRWRKSVHIAFVKLLVFPFRKQLQELNALRDFNIYRLSHDARVGRIEKVLNDSFDLVDRRIQIGDGGRVNSLYIYTPEEDKPVYLPQWIYTPEEISAFTSDFVVKVPASLNLSENDINRLEYLVRYYVEKDKTFTIELT